MHKRYITFLPFRDKILQLLLCIKYIFQNDVGSSVQYRSYAGVYDLVGTYIIYDNIISQFL